MIEEPASRQLSELAELLAPLAGSTTATGSRGRIVGRVTDVSDGTPIDNVVVAGTRALFEPYKLGRRAIGLRKETGRLAHLQLETVRRARRVTGNEPDLAHPVDTSHHHPVPGIADGESG